MSEDRERLLAALIAQTNGDITPEEKAYLEGFGDGTYNKLLNDSEAMLSVNIRLKKAVPKMYEAMQELEGLVENAEYILKRVEEMRSK